MSGRHGACREPVYWCTFRVLVSRRRVVQHVSRLQFQPTTIVIAVIVILILLGCCNFGVQSKLLFSIIGSRTRPAPLLAVNEPTQQPVVK